MRRCLLILLVAASVWLPRAAAASSMDAPSSCPRPQAGALASRPPDLYSEHGVLKVALDYLTDVDAAGRTLFCFRTPSGLESPTLHVHPGDTLDIALTNRLPPLPPGTQVGMVWDALQQCGASSMTATSVNMHFHGTNTSPACHSDEVIHTLINPGETFRYHVVFPPDEPPGLYWYHPHVHGIAESAVLGGASGLIVVDGIQNVQPAVVGLPERLLVIRDQTVGAPPVPNKPVPAWDVSLNYVPVSYPAYQPAAVAMRPGQAEFWRVANAAADTIVDLEVRFDGQPQTLGVVALDGVPVDSQDGNRRGHLIGRTHILLPPAGRAEFIVTGPAAAVRRAELVTRHIDTGPDGDFDPDRPLAILRSAGDAESLPTLAAAAGTASVQRFEGLDDAPVTARRKLYFSEVLSDPKNPNSPTNFYITVDGAPRVLFNPDEPPAITTTQGAVEDWTVSNRSHENHEFHIHQIHFKLLARDGVPVPPSERQMRDTIQVPYCVTKGACPSVTLRMDFRGPDVGDFVYHCHILGHEDAGMMAVVRVLPKG